MEALKYKIQITTDLIHNFSKEIEEIYIPQIGVCFNEAGGAFKNNEPRRREYNKIEVNYSDVVNLEKYVKCKDTLEEVIKTNFNTE
jgi:hypothetical protein